MARVCAVGGDCCGCRAAAGDGDHSAVGAGARSRAAAPVPNRSDAVINARDSVSLVRGDGLGGFNPRGVDHVAQLDGAGGELPIDEGLAGRGTGAGERSLLLQLIGLLDQRVGVAQIGEVVGEDILED